jgi:hypothetical protein
MLFIKFESMDGYSSSNNASPFVVAIAGQAYEEAQHIFQAHKWLEKRRGCETLDETLK